MLGYLLGLDMNGPGYDRVIVFVVNITGFANILVLSRWLLIVTGPTAGVGLIMYAISCAFLHFRNKNKRP